MSWRRITSVSVDHATPAAYYAKQPSRNDYYDIALQALTGTTVDYLAGGGFKKMNGADGQQKSLLDVAKENGWVIPTTNDEIRSLTATNDRVLATNPVLQDSKAIHYEIDRIQKESAGEDVLSLADFVRSGINVLDNDNGFFMMCEGGKIDWAGHANDAATSIYDTIALSDAVQVALDFAAAHPGECLIIVTADHETGGMTIGFATTAYDTHFQYLQNQKTSFTAFDGVISELKESGATFEDAMAKVEEFYGLTTEEGEALSLTATDVENLRKAWNVAMGTQEIAVRQNVVQLRRSNADAQQQRRQHHQHPPCLFQVSHSFQFLSYSIIFDPAIVKQNPPLAKSSRKWYNRSESTGGD